MQDMAQAIADVDLYVHPSLATSSLTLTNLTGHPTVVAPYGFSEEDGVETPTTISFTGHLHEDERLLAFAARWQASTDHHLRHPVLD
jgi:Asp-tRNA(Asn)/Glu-tRNA(Gln) amidotransferase A subunit family amidase